MSEDRRTRSRWVGWGLSGVVVLYLLGDGLVEVFAPDMLRTSMVEGGFAMTMAPALGGITLACALLYAWPRSAVLGAILISGLVGGALCTHLRIDDLASIPALICTLLGLGAWAGLYLRDARLRALIPIRR